jgi:hypothetical protein
MYIVLNGNAHSDSVKPHMDQSANLAGIKAGATMAGRQPAEDGLAEIKHPLSAIMANADAARRWLSRTEPNFHEAIAALDRIVKESVRIDEAITGIRAMAAGESPDASLA